MDLDGGRCLFLVSAILLSSLIEFIAECRYSIDTKLANGIYSLHRANGTDEMCSVISEIDHGYVLCHWCVSS